MSATATLPTAPARRKYLCRIKENAAGVFGGTLGRVTFARFKERLEFEEGKTDPKTGLKTKRFTGRRWYEEPVYELDDASVNEARKRIPFAVLRAGAGIVKLDANWRPFDPHSGKAGEKFTAPASEGDLPLADYVELRPWDGSTPDEVAALHAENEGLRKELEAIKAAHAADETSEADRLAKMSQILGGDREVGPRRKKEGT